MQEKKKILYVITKGNFGGAQKYVFDMATNLPKDKFEAVVACGKGDLLKEKLREENIRTIDLPYSQREIDAGKDWLAFKNLIKIIKEEKPDIVHLNSSKIGLLGSLAVLFLKLSAPSSKLKAVFTSHGWAFNEQNRSFVSKMVFYFGHYLTVFFCNQTIAVSIKTKKDISWLPFIKDKIEVIYNGISDFKRISKKAASEILVKERGQIVIFTLAELHHNKGLDVALRGITLLPVNIREKIQYYIAGDGEEKINLQKLASDLGIEKIIHFLGEVENGKKLLSGADVFLFPSRTENLPFAVLEAGFSGLPIIATSVGGIPEIIKDMQNGILVHPKNPKEIAEGIMYILDHKEKQKEFGEAIKQTVQNFFSLEKMLSQTLGLYSKLLAF